MKKGGLIKSVTTILNRPVLFWSIVAIVFIVARLATWGYPYDSDHWIFYYVGKIWAEGGSLYVDAWDHKPPLIFLFNGIMHLLLGDNIILHRIWLTLLSLGSAVLFYILAKKVLTVLVKVSHRAFNPRLLAKIALILFVFVANLSQFTSSGNNTENYGLLFVLAMWVLFFLFMERRSVGWLLLSGLCFSALFFLKGTFLLFGVPIAIALLMRYYKKWSAFFGFSALFVVPLVAHTLLWLGYFWQKGTLNDFIVASFSFSAKYANSAWSGGVSNEPALLIVCLLLVLPALVGFIVYLRSWHRGRESWVYIVTGASFLLSMIAVGMVGSFYPYYLEIGLPFVVLVAVYALVQLRRGAWRTMAIISVVVLCGVLYAISTKQLLNSFTGAANQSAVEYQSVADYVDKHTTASDKVFDNSYGATFYELTHRNSGSRFVSATPILLDYRDHYGFNLSQLFITDMEKNQTLYVLTVRDQGAPYDDSVVVTQYINSHYHLEKQFNNINVWRCN